jgi:hypothetical protein
MDRHADAAMVAVERRQLWADDGKQLYQIALELSAIAQEMPENDKDAAQSPSREQVIGEAVIALQQAQSAGYAIQIHELPAILRVPYELNNKYAAEVQP